MLKNASVFRIFLNGNAITDDVVERAHFLPTGPTQEHSYGFVPPRREPNAAMVEPVLGVGFVLLYKSETRSVPTAAVKEEVARLAARVERETGRKPGRKERKELKEHALLALLPRAFPKQDETMIWVFPASNTLLVESTSASRCDDVITALMGLANGAVIRNIQTTTHPQSSMARWLLDQEAPEGFTLDRQCELVASDDSHAVVRYGNHPLDIEEVQQHIQHGKLPTLLAMTWDDRVSFVLTGGMHLRSIKFLDVALESQTEKGFDADAAIVGAEMTRLIPDLIEALGGERKE